MSEILLPEQIRNIIHYSIGKASKVVMRNGIILEKGAVLTPRRIDQNFEIYKKYYEVWSVYPDLYLKQILPTSSKFKLKFFQILFKSITSYNLSFVFKFLNRTK